MLLPLDEVPLHVPLRRPRPLRFERLRVGGEGKADANLTNFLSTCCAWHPNSPPRPGEASHPAPSARKSVIRLHRKLPSAPLRAPRRFRNPKIGQQLGAQPTPRFRGMLDALLDALLDPWPPFTFCCPQAIVDEEAGVSIPNSSPFSRSTRLPFTSTPSPPAPLSTRKAPSASVESIEPRPPRPCEVGRPKGRRRKNRRQSHRFFFSTCCAWHPNSPPRPGEAPHPPPLPENLPLGLHRKLPSAPPASAQEVSESENRPATRGTAHSEVQGDDRCNGST